MCVDVAKERYIFSVTMPEAAISTKFSHPDVDGSKVKVKCTLVQALRLCKGRMPHRGSRFIDLLFLDHGTRRGWGVSVTPRPLFTPGKTPYPLYSLKEAGWAPGPVWTGAENLVPTGIRSLDRPSRSELLYRLRYPALDGSTSNIRRNKLIILRNVRFRKLRHE